MRYNIIVSIFLLFSHNTFGENIVYITRQFEQETLLDHTVAMPDSIGLPFEDAASKYFDKYYKPITEVIHFDEPRSVALWAKFTLKNSTPELQKIVFENYNNSINKFEFYNYLGNGKFEIKTLNKFMPFYEREYHQRAFQASITLQPYEMKTFYYYITNDYPTYPIALISSEKFFFNHTYNIYLFLGILFGMVLFSIISNFLNSIITKDNSYFYYFLFILFQFLYFFEGFGFKYLWPNYPEFNIYAIHIFKCGITIFGLLFSVAFLNIRSNSPLYYKICIVAIVYKLAFLIGCILFPTYFTTHMHYYIIDSIFMLTPLVYVAYNYKINTSYVQMYVAAYVCYIVFDIINNCFLYFNLIKLLKTITFNHLSEYAYSHISGYVDEFGLLIQITLMAIAFVKKYQIIFQEKEQNQNDIILQLSENQKLKDNINDNLSKLVNERTQEIAFKNKQLEDFTYKITHDLKSPVNSMIGLANIALEDHNSENTKQYLLQIQKSAVRMKNMVNDVLRVLKEEKNTPVFKEKINWEMLMEEVISGFSHLKDFKKVKIAVTKNIDCDFYSNKPILESIIQNLIENGIKYRNKNTNSFIKVHILMTKDLKTIEIRDNGVGISEEKQPYVFDLFYRASNDNKGSGLGLYLVKNNLEKIGGRITLSSQPGVGTTVKIHFE